MSKITGEYALLVKQLEALLQEETNLLTNISQFCALIFNGLDNLNWAGFYIYNGKDSLQLGPFQGQVACTRIQLGHGVCGTSAKLLKSMIVEDVEQFEGHIACDSRSRSELVVPTIIENDLWGVFDLDSPNIARFSQPDRLGIEALIKVLISSTNWK